MTVISKNVYISKLDKIVDKYNNAYHGTIKKAASVQLSRFFECGIEHNGKDPKFKVGDHMRISKYKNIFAAYQIGLREFLQS